MNDERPRRESVQEGEWRITAQLVRISDEHVLLTTETPLRISDARLNTHFSGAARALSLWLDDCAQALARGQAAAKRARRR